MSARVNFKVPTRGSPFQNLLLNECPSWVFPPPVNFKVLSMAHVSLHVDSKVLSMAHVSPEHNITCCHLGSREPPSGL